MTIRISFLPDQSRLVIDGELTIYTVATATPELLAPLGNNDQLDIALAGVTEIDAAGVQLLILAKKEAMQKGMTLRLVEHSTAVTDVLDLCNLFAFFGDPVLIERNTQVSKEQQHVA